MSSWLFDVLRDGQLRDNQTYVADGRTINNRRWPAPVQFASTGRKTQIWHHEDKVWTFLVQVTQKVSASLRNQPEKSLVFLNEGEYEHNTDDEFLQLHGTGPRNFLLTTGNLIGCVKRGDYSVKISSRFGDAFLRYIIADADGFLELEELGGEHPGGDYDWLLAYLWMIKLKRAFRLGLPKTYVSRVEVTARVRGSVDPVRYLIDGDRAAYLCKYREQSYANPQAALIARAYQQLKSHSFAQGAHAVASQFLMASSGKRATLRELLATPAFTNPFYSDYNRVLELSKRILQNKSIDFGTDSETSAFFFDVSMLFEYFVRKLIKRSGVGMRPKNCQEWAIPSGGLWKPMHKLVPDLIFTSGGKMALFDVKYKCYDFRHGVNREDLFQLHTYVGQSANLYDLAACGFIYPVSAQRWHDEGLEKTSGAISDRFRLGNKWISFHVLFINVPDAAEGFQRAFARSCDLFLQRLRVVMGG